MGFECILLEVENKVAVIKINRPKNLNALNKKTISELSECLESLEQNDEVRVIILTGEGEKAFVAGADIKEFVHFNSHEGAELSSKGHETLFNKIEQLKKPVIAAINGYALGGGLELALSCHFRIAAENAQLGLPELKLGLIPGYGGTQRLTQLVGKGLALEMMLSSKMIDAEQALKQGLVNHVFSLESLITECTSIAKAIARNSPNAIEKLLTAVQFGTDNKQGLQKEITLFGECFGTDDFKEGTSAFLEKRKPNF